MKAIMRGGLKDGLEIELDGKAESVRFPAFPEPNRDRRSPEESPYMWGQIIYHRTERLEGDSVVFI